MSTEIAKSKIPPAILKPSMDIRKKSRMKPPVNATMRSRLAAVIVDFLEILSFNSGVSFSVKARKIGMFPGGSIITKSVVKDVRRKLR
jgi:hypothetical protein